MPAMTPARAIALALVALEEQRHRLAPEANLHDIYGADHPGAVKASQKRAEIGAAMKELEEMLP